MDPAAIGTALIGLEAVRRQSDELPARAPSSRQRARLASQRGAIAAALRTLADSVEVRPREAARGR